MNPVTQGISLESSHYETPRSSPNASLSEHSSVVSTDLEVPRSQVSSEWDQLIERLHELRTCSTDSAATLVPRNNNNPFLCDDQSQVTCTDQIYSKNERIHNSLMRIRSEFDRLVVFEKNIMTLAYQVQSMRESLSQQILLSSELIQDLFQETGAVNLSNKQYSDAQTQTDPTFVACTLLAKSTEKLQHYSRFSSIPQTQVKCNFLNDELQHKLRRMPAMVKGYLVRRLLKTDKVINLKRTISDTSIILVNFKSNLFRDGKLVVTHDDILFHQRLCVQLEKSCKEFYSIFFHYPPAKQMDMINKHRQYLKEMALKEKRSSSVLSHSSLRSQSSRTASLLSNHNK